MANRNMSKDDWVSLFRDVGLSDAQMQQWHRVFEAKHPDDHQGFLEWLDIPQNEIKAIRSM